MRRGELEKLATDEHAWIHYHHPVWNATLVLEVENNTEALGRFAS